MVRDADELILSLPEPIAVVGNGWIRSRHNDIEAHTTIIRFNDYADEGWENHVGHRCDVWCVTCCGQVRFRTLPKTKVMTIATLQEQPTDIPRWLERYPEMAVPNDSWIRLARTFKGFNPSTGLTLLLRLLHHGKRFAAFGFDGLVSGHYWDRLHSHLDSHGSEFPALMELARRGVSFR